VVVRRGSGENAAAGPGDHRPETTDGASGRRELRRRVGGADLRAVGELRGQLRQALGRWGVADLSDTAELLTTELVANALRHTRHGADLTARLCGGPGRRLRVEVRDFTDRLPAVRSAGEGATSGRGLFLVEALADAWGVLPEGGGKVIWFELAVAAP
jgi:anti-sigma regulatory factor (Ser/Thr protein kinase)